MACPQVGDGGDGVHIWRVAVNILNKQSWTANMGWSPSLGVGLTTPHHKNKLVTKCHKRHQTWTYSLEKQHKLKEMDMTFGTWNVRSLYRTGSLMTVAKEMSKYKLDLVGIQELGWDRGSK
jgi:hypothetical protein